MVNFNNTFKNKKILITGHTGFKGTWLSMWLYLLGAKVIGFLKITQKNNTDFFQLGLDKKIYKSYYGDLTKFNKINNICDKHRPEIIINLAAQAIVSEGIKDPLYNFNNNLISTLNILEITRTRKYIKTGIFVTSDKVYKNINNKQYYKENDELFGEDPYSASKSASEIIIHSYLKTFNKNFENRSICTVRAGNVVGGGDYSINRIMPDIIRAFINNDKLIIRSPNSTRPWQYILDCLNGYLRLTQLTLKNPSKYNGSWNFGPNDKENHKVKDVVNIVSKNFKFSKIEFKKNVIKEKKYLNLNIQKSKKYLNWTPKYKFKKLVDLTIDDYLNKKVNKNDFYLHRKKRIIDFMKLK